MGVDVMAGDSLIEIDEALVADVRALGDALRARGWRLATAESCTGGLLSGACTAPAGASDWFTTGFVTYANEAKQALLGVPAGTLAAHGAVSAEVAEAMARGALARGHAQLAVSVTGIAGPGGASAAKPVGTVWLGFAWTHPRETQEGLPAGGDAPRVAARTECLHLAGDRGAIRAQTVAAALRRALSLARDGGAPAPSAP
jgi:nicotinamide-nucleotide amidase